MRRPVWAAIFSICFFVAPATNNAWAAGKRASSGTTQVVARVGDRELTLTDLRLEMSRLGVSPADQDAEQRALDSLVNRTVLADAARDINFHRKPEAMARMYAAQDQALADLFLATAAEPPEPTRAEVDAYVSANTDLFRLRRAYDFSILTLPTRYFDEEVLTPLFDEEEDFTRVVSILSEAGAESQLSVATQYSSSFPVPIRAQLAQYSVNDNIVLKGSETTQILKIIGVRDAALPTDQWGVLGRQMLLQEARADRAEAHLARLKTEARVEIFHDKTVASADRPSASPDANANGP